LESEIYLIRFDLLQRFTNLEGIELWIVETRKREESEKETPRSILCSTTVDRWKVRRAGERETGRVWNSRGLY
jgi:hypothetical protein